MVAAPPIACYFYHLRPEHLHFPLGWRSYNACVEHNKLTAADKQQEEQEAVSSVTIAGLPWAFTQNRPLTTSDFISEAKRRDFDFDLSVMRELYRHGLVVPFVYISPWQVGPIPEPVASEPSSSGTWLTELRLARDRGRLCDLASVPFRPRLRLESKERDSRHWWNGLLYSRYQVLVLPELQSVLNGRQYRRRNGRIVGWLPKPHEFVLQRAVKFRRIALVLTALEARYLPKLDPEWLNLVNTDEKEWQQYRDSFDPAAMAQQLRYPATQARQVLQSLFFAP